jgi:hypothetical protein
VRFDWNARDGGEIRQSCLRYCIGSKSTKPKVLGFGVLSYTGNIDEELPFSYIRLINSAKAAVFISRFIDEINGPERGSTSVQ